MRKLLDQIFALGNLGRGKNLWLSSIDCCFVSEP